MGTANNSIIVDVVKTNSAFYGSDYEPMSISCNHQRIEEVRLATQNDANGDCIGGVAAEGDELPMEYYGDRDSVVTVKINDAIHGFVWVERQSYLDQLDNCSACCIEP